MPFHFINCQVGSRAFGICNAEVIAETIPLPAVYVRQKPQQTALFQKMLMGEIANQCFPQDLTKRGSGWRLDGCFP